MSSANATTMKIENAKKFVQLMNDYKVTGVDVINKKKIAASGFSIPSAVTSYHQLKNKKTLEQIRNMTFLLRPGGKVELRHKEQKMLTLSDFNFNKPTFRVNNNQIDLTKVKTPEAIKKELQRAVKKNGVAYFDLESLAIPKASAWLSIILWVGKNAVSIVAAATGAAALHHTVQNSKKTNEISKSQLEIAAQNQELVRKQALISAKQAELSETSAKYIAQNTELQTKIAEHKEAQERSEKFGLLRCRLDIEKRLEERVFLTITNILKLCRNPKIPVDVEVVPMLVQKIAVSHKKRNSAGELLTPQALEPADVQETTATIAAFYVHNNKDFPPGSFGSDPGFCDNNVIPMFYGDLEIEKPEPGSRAAALRLKMLALSKTRSDIVEVLETQDENCFKEGRGLRLPESQREDNEDSPQKSTM